MNKFSGAIGDFVAPIIFMGFVGYVIGKYSGRMALSIVICVLLGFMAALVNMWKLMKKLGHNDD